MKMIGRWMALAGLASALSFATTTLVAQDRPGRGNFDPEQFRQRQMERYRETLEIKDDAEWKLIQERIEKVLQARREVGGMGPGAFGRMGRGPGGGGGGARAEGDNQGGQGGGRGNRGGGGFGGFNAEPSPEAEALQKAIEAKASNDEIKAKLAKVRDARKQKEGNLEKAQEELRKVLSVRQEAAAVLAGLIK